MNLSKKLNETKNVERMKDILIQMERNFPKFSSKEYNFLISAVLDKFYVEEYYELLSVSHQKIIKSFFIDHRFPCTCLQQIMNNIHRFENSAMEEFPIFPDDLNNRLGTGYRRMRTTIQEIVFSKKFPSLLISEHQDITSKNRFFLTMEDISRLIVTIPDKIIGIKNLTYHSKILKNLFSSYEEIRKRKEEPETRELFSSLVISILSLICKRGYSDIASHETLRFIRNASQPKSTLVSILEGWKTRFTSQISSFKKFVFCLLKQSSKRKNSGQIFRILVNSFTSLLIGERKSQNKILTVFITSEILIPPETCHLFIYRDNDLSSPSSICQSFIATLLRSSGLLGITMEHLFSFWKQNRFVKFSPEETQEGITRMILLLLHLSMEESVSLKNKNTLQRLIIDGVNFRLSSPIVFVRRHAVFMAEKFSEMVGQKVEFDEFKGEKTKLEEEFTKMMNHFKDLVLPKKKTEETETPPPEPKQKKVEEPTKKNDEKKKKKRRIIEPDAPAFGDDSSSSSESESESSSEEEEEEEEEISDTDSLASFGLGEEDEDNEDLKRELEIESLKKPVFIRDVIPLLTANTDDDHVVEKIELGLKHFEDLVRSSPGDLSHISEKLTKCLLYLNDTYSIEGFSRYQKNGLIALILHSTKNVVSVLLEEFFLPRRALNKRSLILRVLRQSAMEISNRNLQDSMPSLSLSERRKKEKKEEEEARAQIRKKYKNGNKTKIWGRFRETKKVEAEKNDFLKVAEQFFFPLISGYDTDGRIFRMLSGESYLFSEYLTTLTSFVYCCGSHYVGFKLAGSLLEFLWFVKYHFRGFSRETRERSKRDFGILGSNLRIIKNNKNRNEGEAHLEKNREKDLKAAVAVRRAVLHAFLVVVSLMPGHVLLEQENKIGEYVDWLIEVQKHDADEKSREFAIFTLGTLKEKIKM